MGEIAAVALEVSFDTELFSNVIDKASTAAQ